MSGAAIGAVAVLVTALFSYVVQSRKISGNIDTTEASSLWQESASIREDYRQQIASLRENLRSLETRVTVAESANAQLIEANTDLARQLHEAQDTCTALRVENESLKRTIRKVARGDHPDSV